MALRDRRQSEPTNADPQPDPAPSRSGAPPSAAPGRSLAPETERQMLGAVNRFSTFASKVVELLDWQTGQLVALNADTGDFVGKLEGHRGFQELRESLRQIANLKANDFEGIQVRFAVLQHNVIALVEAARGVRTLILKEGNPGHKDHIAQALDKFLRLLPDEAVLESWDSLNLPPLPGHITITQAVVETPPEEDLPLPVVEDAIRASVAELNPIYNDPLSQHVDEQLLFLHLLSTTNARARDLLFNLYPKRKTHPELEQLGKVIAETTWHLHALRKGDNEAHALLRRDASVIFTLARKLSDPYRSASIISEMGYSTQGAGRTSEATLAYSRLAMFTNASQVFAADLLRIPERRIQREPFAPYQDIAVTLGHNARKLQSLLDPLSESPKSLWSHFMRLLQRRIGVRERWMPLPKEEAIPLLQTIAAHAEIARRAAIRGFAREFNKELWVHPVTHEVVEEPTGATDATLDLRRVTRQGFEMRLPMAALKGSTDCLLDGMKDLKQEYEKQLPLRPAAKEGLSARVQTAESLIQQMLRKAEGLPALRQLLPKGYDGPPKK